MRSALLISFGCSLTVVSDLSLVCLQVHCLRESGLREGGDSSGTGTVWEHMLSLLRCPFLALSATIGNPQEFVQWLSSLKQLQQQQDQQQGKLLDTGSYDVELIQHSHRHADLRVYTYAAGDMTAAQVQHSLPPPVTEDVAGSSSEDDIPHDEAQSHDVSIPHVRGVEDVCIEDLVAAFERPSSQLGIRMPKLHPAAMLSPQQVCKHSLCDHACSTFVRALRGSVMHALNMQLHRESALCRQ